MLIALDIDGVILDFLGHFLKIYNNRNGTSLTTDDITDFLPSGNLDDLIKKKDWDENFDFFVDNGGFSSLPSFEGARVAIENIIKAGHHIVYITAREPKLSGQTIISFILNNIPLKKIYFAPHSKEQALKDLNPDIFVDDRLKHLEEAERAGVRNIYVMDQPYNKKLEAKKYTRIYNLIQLEREIAPIKDEK